MSTPPNALKPPPPGYGYKEDPAHGMVLVQLTPPAAGAAPAAPPGAPQSAPEDYAFHRGQNFDVVLMRKGVNGMEAKPDDFKRVAVGAVSSTAAREAPEVAAAAGKDFEVHQVTGPGHTTEFENMARQRAAAAARGDLDRSMIGGGLRPGEVPRAP